MISASQGLLGAVIVTVSLNVDHQVGTLLLTISGKLKTTSHLELVTK
jgi:hypothetical protein